MNYGLLDLIDKAELEKLLDHISPVAKCLVWITGVDGAPLVPARKAGFMRPAGVNEADRCPAGLVECTAPIVIGDTRIADLTAGRFLLVPPDDARLAAKAETRCDDAGGLSDAQRGIPVISHDTLESVNAALALCAQFIAGIALRRAGELHALEELQKSRRMLRRAEERSRSQMQTNTDAIMAAGRYKLLADNSTDVIMILRPWGTIEYVSPSSEKVLGYRPDEMLGKKLVDFVHGDDLPGFLGERHSISAENRAFIINYRIISKSGNIIWVEMNGQVFFDDSGKPHEIQASLRDVTRRMEQDEALTRAAAEIEDLYNKAPFGYHSSDRDGIIRRINDTELAMLGYSRDEIVGKKTLRDLMADKSKADYDRIRPIVIREGALTNQEVEFIRKDGTLLFTLLNSRSEYDDDGSFCGFRTSMFDITELRYAEAELKSARERYRALFTTMNEGVSVHDLIYDDDGHAVDYVIKDVNPSYADFTGISVDKAIGSRASELYGTPEPPYFDIFRNVAETGKPASFSTYFEPLNRHYTISVFSPEPGSFACVFNDVSALKKIEQDLQAAKDWAVELISTASAMCVVLDECGDILEFNRAAEEITGYSRQEVIGRNWLDMILPSGRYPDEREKIVGIIHQAFQGHRSEHENVILTRSGDERIIAWRNSPVMSGGRITGIVGFGIDLTSRIRAEESLHEEKERLSVTLQSIGDGVVATDSAGKIVIMNRAAEELTGYAFYKAYGAAFQDVFDLYHDDTDRLCESPVERVLKTGSVQALSGVHSTHTITGQVYYISANVSPILDLTRKIIGAIFVFRNVTDAKRREDEVRYISYHDMLTGLYNRAFFDEECSRLDTERQLPISVIMGDVNGLKLTNDVFGHAAGDRLLSRIAAILRECSRKEDILARMGGDEFCLLLPKTDGEQAAEICRRITGHCDLVDSGLFENTKLSISLGHSTKMGGEEPLDTIIKAAEDQMYRNKLLESRSQHSSIITSIRATLFEKSFETEQHAQRLSELSKAIAVSLRLSENEIHDIELFALLHDIGKIAIDSRILAKRGKLTVAEWAEIRRHPEIGYRIAQSLPDLTHISEFILYHHERWDGCGYPHGLKGENIPLLDRILQIVDAYDVMTHGRVYKKAISSAEACNELFANAGKQFDPDILQAFLAVVNA